MRHHRLAEIVLLLTLVLLVACSAQDGQQSQQSELSAVSVEDLDIATGQTIYVPAYSQISSGAGRELDLAITLSIRNSDFDHPIVIKSARYYDSNGELVEEYADPPFELGPLASTEIVIDRDDTRGGAGANFIVEWVSEESVYEPITEAVMIDTGSQQGISFVSRGQVIKEK